MNGNQDLIGVTERNYQFQRQLYRYTEAELWEATHIVQHNTYWVLAFDAWLSEKPERFNKVSQSIETFSSLQHPHMLGVSESWENAEGRLFVALSYLPNAMPLYELRGQLASGEIQYIFSELVGLIEWANDWGLVLDLRPDQIFVRQRPFAFRYLFLPRNDSLAVLRTQSDIGRSDSRYLSPEEVDGWPQTKASAYFTLGTVLFETVTGQDAFRADTALSSLEMIRRGYSPTIQQASLDIGIRSLLEQLMQPNPDFRLKDSQTVRDLLREAIGRGSWSAQGTADASLISVPIVEEDIFDDQTNVSSGGFGSAPVSSDWLAPPRDAVKAERSGKPLFQTPDDLTPGGSPIGTGTPLAKPRKELTAIPQPAPTAPGLPPSPAPTPQRSGGPPMGGGGPPPLPPGGPPPVIHTELPASPSYDESAYPPSPAYSESPAGYGYGGAAPQQQQPSAPVFYPSEPEPEHSKRRHSTMEKPTFAMDGVISEASVIRDDELYQHQQVSPQTDQVKVLRRKGVVRHYSQMNPGKVFPLLVSIIEAEMYIKIPNIANVQQVESDKVLEIQETSPLVRLVPVIPGCLVSPPEAVVDVRRPKIDVTFWVAPQAEGDFRRSARVEVWHEGVCQDAIPLPCVVRTQTITKMASVFSVLSSMSGAFLEAFIGNKNAVASGGIAPSENVSWAAILAKKFVVLLSSSGLWLGLFFLITAFLSYLWLKPRQGDVIERFLNSEIH